MNIVCLLESPGEKGNTAAIPNRSCTAGEKPGAEVKTYVLNEISYSGCQGCMACKT